MGWVDPEYQDHVRKWFATGVVILNRLSDSRQDRTPEGIRLLLTGYGILREGAAVVEDERGLVEAVEEFIGRLRGLAVDVERRPFVNRLGQDIWRSLSGLAWAREANSSLRSVFEQSKRDEAVLAAEETIDHTLARLFLLLGPPPEPSAMDYEPAGRGGGGAEQ
ncbi:hypothetical protein ABT403_37550 [Streptomyces sp. NPDC000075]|uniref:hypothetical protein n=1 Tax=Streptomyces TaxID=1883 RepID=UPI0031D79DD1